MEIYAYNNRAFDSVCFVLYLGMDSSYDQRLLEILVYA